MKKSFLKNILESSEGIHLTAYLVNRHDVADLKVQLREVINEAYEWLYEAINEDERNKFLEPLDNLLKDASIFQDIKGHVGIFRKKDYFRILSIPVPVEKQCHVATSFHVKPLLRWMQIDREFMLLGFDNESAHLYLGNQTSLQKIDSILLPKFFEKDEKSFLWINDWILRLTRTTKPPLFLAGETSLADTFLNKLKYEGVVKTPLAKQFQEHRVNELTQVIRALLNQEAKKYLEKSLMEFRFAEEINLVKKNIFQIAKAAVRGRIKKLIIADGIQIFGQINKKTGGLAIHPFDLNHQDDDLLDDLAQTVLSAGGEVVVVPQEDIPKGRPILAILEHPKSNLELQQELKKLALSIERSPA